MSYSYQASFTFQGGEDKEDPDLVYYNADIINNGSQSNPITPDYPDPVIRFSETRDAPIIKDASKYNFSIIRFTMNGPGKDIPIFIPQIRIGPIENPGSNINLTIYDVGLSMTVRTNVGGTPYTNQFYQYASVIWEPEIVDATVASAPSASSTQTAQNLSTRYYWCMSVSHWINLVNKAYLTAWQGLQTQYQTWWNATLPGPPAFPGLLTKPPRLTWNQATNLVSIYADTQGYGDNEGDSVPSVSGGTTYFHLLAGASGLVGGTEEDWSIWMDANTYGMFGNFQTKYYNQASLLTPSKTYKILITNISQLYQNILNVPQQLYAATHPDPYTPVIVKNPPGTGTSVPAAQYWVMTQEAPTTDTLWSPVASIVFTTGTIPLVFEQTGDPIRFGTGNLAPIANQAAFIPTITDIAATNLSCFDYRGFISYLPQAEYRLASFQKSKTPINQIDIQVFWKNRLDGNLYPLYMYNLSSVSIKVMFRRRGVMDFPHPANTNPVNF